MGRRERLAVGAYEALITDALQHQIDELDLHTVAEVLDPAEASGRLTHHLQGVLHRWLEQVPKKDRPAAQADLVNTLMRWLGDTSGTAVDPVVNPPRVLTQITPHLLPGQTLPRRPDVPLLDHDLLANAPGEPSLSHALATELATADRVDAVIAFIRQTGLNAIKPALQDLHRRGVPIRVLTTTFTGSTERAALEWLIDHGADVRVSYDTRTTRLHAKAWMIHRDSGFSTAYVGSSNLSHAALVDGIEWNVRLAEARASEVLAKLRATFDTLWNEGSFEAYDPTVDADRFDHAILRTRVGTAATGVSGLDVTPHSYQREMLQALVADRSRGRIQTLVVAPTGTGKTVVAGLDYKALREGDGGLSLGSDPSVLFVAHREQILDQSLQTFRDVLKRGSFGEKLYGGSPPPRDWRHVFASIQSLTNHLDRIPADQFDVVYIDEFHHAEAATYRRLIDHLRPKATIGLTATPERADGRNVRDLFGGRTTFDMRLWDALDQQLLSPFHYYGISDGTNLASLKWERGGYRISDLERLYVVDGHDARTAKVITALREQVTDPHQMRAFGFCVSIQHARYMANRFTAAGIPAVAMTAETSSDQRIQQLDALRDRTINVVFAVDVLTEGVDVPEVDTVLLLRPTESATVFLQQLGRGLRLHPGKSVCTVLDFVGQQHVRFRSDLRLRALTGRARGQLIADADQGFPYLPVGCHIQLDRQAEAAVIANLKAVVNRNVRALAAELRDLQRDRTITLAGFLTDAAVEREDVYRGTGSWTSLRRRAGTTHMPDAGPRENELAKGIKLRLQQVDDPERLTAMRLLAAGESIPDTPRSRRAAEMVAFVLFDDGRAPESLEAVVDALRSERAIREELDQLADVLDDEATVRTRPSTLDADVPLHLHATYTRSEVLVAFEDRRLGQTTAMREGVKHLKNRNIDLLFVTLEKSEQHYSPSTRYADYAVSRELFHWESQSGTTRRSPTGKRYLEGGSDVLLFVRRQNKDARGRTPGFMFLGPVDRVDDRGEQPIQITWRLRTPMPEQVFTVARGAAG